MIISKTTISIILLLNLFSSGFSQNNTTIGIGFLPDEDIAIFGLSLGIFSADNRQVVTIGSRIEIIGAGVLVPLAPGYPDYVSEITFNKKIDRQIKKGENVYGLDLALAGSFITGEVIGLSSGIIGGSKTRLKGLMIHGIGNMVEDSYGCQLAVLFNINSRLKGAQFAFRNISQKVTGIQIGLFNETKDLDGFQIGIWNKNNKRSLPLINWDF